MTASTLVSEECNAGRIDWVDHAKGICIVAVVCFYSTVYVQDITRTHGWLNYWVDFARPFRMPDFFLVSGLFLSRVIERPWHNYLDKKVLHYFYFFALWTTLYWVASVALVKAGFSGKPPAEYLWWYIEPFHQLWFIAMLPIFCIVTRVIRRIPWLIVLPLAALLQIAHPESGWRQLDRFGERYVYFYAGYALAPLVFALATWAQKYPRKAGVALISWAIVNEALVLRGVSEWRGFSLALGFAGAAAVMASASLLTRWRVMNWLRYLGQNSIVIFLAFYAVMTVALHVILSSGLISDSGSQALALSVISILGPILLYWMLRPTPARFLFQRPGWIKLSGKPSSIEGQPLTRLQDSIDTTLTRSAEPFD